MAKTPSKDIKLGINAPDFNLLNPLDNAKVSLKKIRGKKGTVVMFICNHCPFVQHIIEPLTSIGNSCQKDGIGFVAISANDAEQFPDDAPEQMAKPAKEKGFEFPYLYDETQDVAKAYDAACTPDLFVYDKDLNLYYHGSFDKTHPGQGESSDGAMLSKVLKHLKSNKEAPVPQLPSIGCNIKWK